MRKLVAAPGLHARQRRRDHRGRDARRGIGYGQPARRLRLGRGPRDPRGRQPEARPGSRGRAASHPRGRLSLGERPGSRATRRRHQAREGPPHPRRVAARAGPRSCSSASRSASESATVCLAGTAGPGSVSEEPEAPTRASAVPRDADVTAYYVGGGFRGVAWDPSGDPVRGPYLQEPLVRIDDLDLVATVEAAELERADGIGLGADPDTSVADLRALGVLRGRLVEDARRHGWQHRRPAGRSRRRRVHGAHRAGIRSRRVTSGGGNEGEAIRDQTIVLVLRPPEQEQEEQHATRGRDRPDREGVHRHAGKASPIE